jgi:serine/threonine protein kinase
MQATLTAERGPATGSSWTVRAGQTIVIGNAQGVQVRLRDERLLPQHASIVLGPAGLVVMDLGGAAGTSINGTRLPPQVPRPANDGDVLEVGETLLRVEGEGLPRPAPATVALKRLEEPGPLGAPGELEVVRELGRGAMGRVLEVRRAADGRAFAAKLLFEEVDPASEDFQRFVAEGRVTARVKSPYVVEVHDLRIEGGRVMLLMELVRGPSLSYALDVAPPLVPDVLRVGQDVAEALAAIHGANIVHRDVKPSNVLLDPRGVAKLSDFGIAKDLAAKGVTKTGQGLGTLDYMPPEQLYDAKRVSPQADLYSLAATLYHCLAGTPPFIARTPGEAMREVCFKPAPSVAKKRPDLPPELVALIDGLLVKEPAERRATARDVADALRAMRLRHFPGQRGEGLFQLPRP